MHSNRRFFLYATVAAVSALLCQTGLAQTYPERAITLIVSYPPGGDTDAMARQYAEKLS